MNARRIDHVGVIVRDLAAAKAFFLDLGLELKGEGEAAGAWVDKVIGLEGARSSFAMVGPPGGGANIELIQFRSPEAVGETGPLPSNALGLRHIAILVDDIDEAVARARARGGEPFGEVQDYEDVYRLVYVRGPEGIIVELAQEMRGGESRG